MSSDSWCIHFTFKEDVAAEKQTAIRAKIHAKLAGRDFVQKSPFLYVYPHPPDKYTLVTLFSVVKDLRVVGEGYLAFLYFFRLGDFNDGMNPVFEPGR